MISISDYWARLKLVYNILAYQTSNLCGDLESYHSEALGRRWNFLLWYT